MLKDVALTENARGLAGPEANIEMNFNFRHRCRCRPNAKLSDRLVKSACHSEKASSWLTHDKHLHLLFFKPQLVWMMILNTGSKMIAWLQKSVNNIVMTASNDSRSMIKQDSLGKKIPKSNWVLWCQFDMNTVLYIVQRFRKHASNLLLRKLYGLCLTRYV